MNEVEGILYKYYKYSEGNLVILSKLLNLKKLNLTMKVASDNEGNG